MLRRQPRPCGRGSDSTRGCRHWTERMSETPKEDSRNAVTITAAVSDSGGADTPASVTPAPVAAPAPNTAPVRARDLGPVRLICEIGRGGMGVVWRGRQQVLGRD